MGTLFQQNPFNSYPITNENYILTTNRSILIQIEYVYVYTDAEFIVPRVASSGFGVVFDKGHSQLLERGFG